MRNGADIVDGELAAITGNTEDSKLVPAAFNA
jgi:hypothetical protein